jgi:hypothetical protein
MVSKLGAEVPTTTLLKFIEHLVIIAFSQPGPEGYRTGVKVHLVPKHLAEGAQTIGLNAEVLSEYLEYKMWRGDHNPKHNRNKNFWAMTRQNQAETTLSAIYLRVRRHQDLSQPKL